VGFAVIGRNDRLSLPAGVALTASGLRDDVRGVELPLNEAARVVVQSATPGAAAAALCARFRIDERRALVDTRSFCAELNHRMLLNLRTRSGAATLAVRWAVTAARQLPFGARPSFPTRRRAVDTTSMFGTAASGARALAPGTVALGAWTAAATALALSALGTRSLPLALTAGAAVAVGVFAHELGHLLALRGVPACLVTRGLRLWVLHRPLGRGREALVALAGPVAGTTPALLVLAVFLARGSPEAGIASLLLSLQLVGCTVLTRDGRRLCADW
jgi:hypothetical protein